MRFVVRAMLIMESTGLDVTKVLASRTSIPRRLTVNISSRPSELAALGWVLSSRLARCLACAAQLGVGVVEGLHQPRVDPRLFFIWWMISNIPALVEFMPISA